jgi:3D (Asp-Asp-Asp) domain-containing protein
MRGLLIGLALAAAALGARAEPVDAPAPDPLGDLIATTLSPIDAPPDWRLRPTLYHSGARGVGTRDSLGCRVSPMRTLAVDPALIPRHTILFIKETVGLVMPDGSLHDGYWYASDVGGAIKGARVDLFTGMDAGSMRQFFARGLNAGLVSAVNVGSFTGCPPPT